MTKHKHSTDPDIADALDADAAKLRAQGADPGLTLDDLFNEHEAEQAAQPLPAARVLTEEEQAQVDAYWENFDWDVFAIYMDSDDEKNEKDDDDVDLL